jgi:transposase
LLPYLGRMGRFDLTDQQWARLEPLLPPERPRTGRPNHDHRRILNGILWVHRTGAPWRDLPERYGSFGTVSSRFYRWRKAGIWDRVLAALQASADARGEVDWGLHFVDATIVRAHQHDRQRRFCNGPLRVKTLFTHRWLPDAGELSSDLFVSTTA